MKIEVRENLAYIHTPYNPDFVKKIKGIGGAKWNASEKCWTIPQTSIDAVREIMTNVYGYNDIQSDDTISLRITFKEEVSECCDDVTLFGKVLAHAFGRDRGAKVGNDVAFISGGVSSGGSVRNWRSIVEKGSVVILSNVNKSIYEKAEVPDSITVEILETKTDRQKLLNEKAKLLARIEEIDSILNR